MFRGLKRAQNGNFRVMVTKLTLPHGGQIEKLRPLVISGLEIRRFSGKRLKQLLPKTEFFQVIVEFFLEKIFSFFGRPEFFLAGLSF